jgi:hypothetical protein
MKRFHFSDKMDRRGVVGRLSGGGPALIYAPARAFSKGGGDMPELLEGLEQLTCERGNSLQRASRELTAEPEGFLLVAREACKFVELLCDFWTVIGLRLRKGGVPAKRLLQVADGLVKMGDFYTDYLGRVVEEWPERNLPVEWAEATYAEVQSARQRLNALMEDVRKTRGRAAAPSRISADPAELKRRIKQTDEKGEWVCLTDAGSRIGQGGSQKQE